MRHRRGPVVVALALGAWLIPFAPADARLPAAHPSAAPKAALAKGCPRGRRGVINGRRMCLDKWQVCQKRYESQYQRYNFTCDLLAKGRYHLDYTYYPGDLPPA
ncbi:MAG: hypothetical protein QOI65_1597 [Thermoleophilaceae bacterium]|nr:hypothetical protein [Thermoleophilaceae bacterium]